MNMTTIASTAVAIIQEALNQTASQLESSATTEAAAAAKPPVRQNIQYAYDMPKRLGPKKKSTLDIIIASCVLSILLVVLVVAVMKWKKKDEEEMRLKEEEYMSRRVSAANIARTKGKSRRGSTAPDNFKKVQYSRSRRHSNAIVIAAQQRRKTSMDQQIV